MIQKMNILHLTDFHTSKNNHKQFVELCKNINDAIKNLGEENYPHVILVTGDLTEVGNQDEYKWFKEGFNEMLQLETFHQHKCIMLIPGNHDFSWQVEETRDESFRQLCSQLEKGLSKLDNADQETKANKNLVKHLFVEEQHKNILLIGMNSMKIDSKEKPGLGYFSKDQLRIVENIINTYKTRSTKRMQILVAFHHHLLPVAVLERETLENKEKYSLTIDSRRAINTFLDNEVEFAVHGHQHQPSMVTWKDDERKDNRELHVISAGCLAGKMYAGESARNSFMLYSIRDNKVIVNKAESSEKDSDVYIWDSIVYSDIPCSSDTVPLNSSQDEVPNEINDIPCSPDTVLVNSSQDEVPNEINKKRILDLAKQDDLWISQADQMGPLTIKGLVENLVDSIAADGSVSYEVNIKKRYRTSTLATVLECMYDIHLLPEEDLNIMQSKLLSLKNSFIPLDETDDVIKKAPEDLPAWGIDEAPSVWTTSKALSALFTTKYEPNSKQEEESIAESVMWLANQAYDDGGWGYQKYDEIEACSSNVPMTALAMKALGLSLKQNYILGLVNIAFIDSKLRAGIDFLKKNKEEVKDKKCVWQYDGKENLSVTIWALEAWKIACEVIQNKQAYYSKGYRNIKPITLKYVVENLPEKDTDNNWTECFFRAKKEGGLKYKNVLNRDKAFYSFTPYIISYIIKEDNAFIDSPKIISVLKWVLAHRDNAWLIPTNYNSNNACTISVAMAINVIVNWLKVRTNNLLEDYLDGIFS